MRVVGIGVVMGFRFGVKARGRANGDELLWRMDDEIRKASCVS
ncbi:hypothetical protein KS4_32850 [Poriferisphaera corsica]|uniref:Uncharacterized protein n=1 Tax=Poriferisphaera corsica TaxID=2528020 RepID=A0A517YYB3_9BACT|nr:hypothetical protein KS4_32850 [Poriferisphaera corsica]